MTFSVFAPALIGGFVTYFAARGIAQLSMKVGGGRRILAFGALSLALVGLIMWLSTRTGDAAFGFAIGAVMAPTVRRVKRQAPPVA